MTEDDNAEPDPLTVGATLTISIVDNGSPSLPFPEVDLVDVTDLIDRGADEAELRQRLDEHARKRQMNRPPKASDITDAEIIAVHHAVRGRNGVPRWSTRWEIQAALPQWPPKVVLAKLRSMIRRKVLGGCGCGCRGDFEIR